MLGKRLMWVGAVLLAIAILVGGSSEPHRANYYHLLETGHPTLARIVDGIGSPGQVCALVLLVGGVFLHLAKRNRGS